MDSREFDIVIVGAGPAGMAAAAEASRSGRAIALVDENPDVGGQIWRAEMGRRSHAAARLLGRVGRQVTFISGAEVYDAKDGAVLCETRSGTAELQFSKLVIATGARERFLPFPGWTLPGVFGAGGLQALVKGGFDVNGKRIVIAGSGPLLLAVAAYLKRKGAVVAAIVEQAPPAAVNRLARSLWRSPVKAFQGLALKASLLRVPYVTDSYVKQVSRANGFLRVETSRGELECDLLGCGFHLVPNLELPAILGCAVGSHGVEVDGHQMTSVPGVYCAGESTGIGGLEKSLIEGEIAGLAAAGGSISKTLLTRRRRASAFAKRLNKAFELRDELKDLADERTIVCRCEDVSAGVLKGFASWRDAKLQTRCGMGPCQGRICGPALEFMFGWEPASVRPPIYPVRMENL